VGEEYLVAYHTPCIGVPKGNPSGITSLEDMTQEGVRVILGDPDANAIGKTAQKIIEKNGLEAIYENVVSYSATVNEIVMQLSVNQADAAIVTIDNVYNNDDIEIIEIPDAENIDQKIPVCTLTYSENADEAQAFVEFISSEEGKEIFKENGFKPVE
jgi:molybdate transport system substrate-binding protein